MNTTTRTKGSKLRPGMRFRKVHLGGEVSQWFTAVRVNQARARGYLMVDVAERSDYVSLQTSDVIDVEAV